MTEATSIIDLLKQYETAMKASNDVQAEFDKAVSKVMPEDVTKAIQDINTEFAPLFEAAAVKVSERSGALKAVDPSFFNGESVKGTTHYAYVKDGNVSWDEEMLLKICKEHPEVASKIMAARKKGKPAIVVQPVRK